MNETNRNLLVNIHSEIVFTKRELNDAIEVLQERIKILEELQNTLYNKLTSIGYDFQSGEFRCK